MLGALFGLFIVAIAWAFRDGFGIAFGLLVGLVGLTAAIGWQLLKLVKVNLITADFGLCPGIRPISVLVRRLHRLAGAPDR